MIPTIPTPIASEFRVAIVVPQLFYAARKAQRTKVSTLKRRALRGCTQTEKSEARTVNLPELFQNGKPHFHEPMSR